MAFPLKRFPANPVTPHGAYMILHDRVPMVNLTSFDDTVVFHLMGGLSIADRFASPERVEILDIVGLIAPWKMIDQKGATQHGVTGVTALADPAEIKVRLRIRGRNPAKARETYSALIDSIHAIKKSRLSFFSHRMGNWWAMVRWYQAPDDPITIVKRTQVVSLRLRIDDAFWRTYPSVSAFQFSYREDEDGFDGDDADDLGAGWETLYYGGGTGTIRRHNSQAVSTMANGRGHVSRKVGYTSATNNQVLTFVLGTNDQWFFPTDGVIHMWLRMNNTGDPGDSGLRFSLYRHWMRLSYFVDGVETVIRETILVIPPLLNEKWTVIAGQEGNERKYIVMRGSIPRMTVVESGAGSPLGEDNLSAGFGGKTTSTQKIPGIRSWSIGDNVTISQEGFVERTNPGDQDLFDDYICRGPGMFKFWNGPFAGPDEYVEFGPILENQTVYLRTDPNKRTVKDQTQTPASPQDLNIFQEFLAAFLDFATGNNATPLAEEIKSWFGVKPPQGNLYRLLKGRWSDDAAIPAKSPGKPITPYYVKVAIDDGNANSQIIATGTPLRRNPL